MPAAYALRIEHFDAWASNFTAQVTRLELAPEGTHYRLVTRVAKFRNVPDRFMGLDVKRFLVAMEEVLRPVTTADPLPERGEIELDPARVPTISLEYDPFENGEAERYNRPEKF